MIFQIKILDKAPRVGKFGSVPFVSYNRLEWVKDKLCNSDCLDIFIFQKNADIAYVFSQLKRFKIDYKIIEIEKNYIIIKTSKIELSNFIDFLTIFFNIGFRFSELNYESNPRIQLV